MFRESRIWSALLAVGIGCVWGCASLAPCPDGGRVPALAADETDASLFLIGDAGNPAPGGEPVLAALRTAVEDAAALLGAERVAVVFLGDNVYPNGLAEDGRGVLAGRLDASLDVFAGLAVPPRPIGYFVPGNHDWHGDRRDGRDRLRREQERIAEAGGGRATLLPRDGCPGPEVVDLGERLRLVLLDTQWWLRDAEKSGACAADDEDAVLERLRAALAEAGGRSVVVAGHHPLVSGGRHGGHGRRWWPFRRRQDLGSPGYRHLIASLENAFASAPPRVYAAGHEHNLQLVDGGGSGFGHQVVSGAGSRGKVTRVAALAETVFCRAESGFVRLDAARNGRIRFAALVVEASGEAREASSADLR